MTASDTGPCGLDTACQVALTALAGALVDVRKARVLVEPYRRAAGFWFGGGNMLLADDGAVLLVGRYRNHGDSRTGLAAGERGLELAVFHAPSFAEPFEKVLSFGKAQLACNGAAALSIEGAALRRGPDGIELFVSSEKDLPYPPPVAAFRKPGTGVWTIDVMCAPSVAALDPGTIREVVGAGAPERLHVKDPVVFDRSDGSTAMLYCTHPFAWSSSNTGLAVRVPGAAEFNAQPGFVLERGPVWDIAVTRLTDRLAVPRLGLFRDLPPLSLYFYDGAECVRQHEPHGSGVQRPRGYSCEEIGGLAWGWDDAFPAMHRLSLTAPLFVSPHGTGCNRYVQTLQTETTLCAAWQQSQPDLSQPLVGHALSMETVAEILAGNSARHRSAP